jgi:hypothetical protein
MSAALSQPAERDDASDHARRAEFERRARLATLNALGNAPIRAGSRDREDVLALRRLVREGAALTQKQAERIAGLAWKYRRHMPRGTAPILPPHDPIVREMETTAHVG